MLARACDWAARRGGDFFVSVNVSPSHVCSPKFVEHVDEALAFAHLPPDRLRLELTEHAAWIDDKQAETALRALCERGVKMDLDDFGTGYSAADLLIRLPVASIKIDRSLIAGLDGDARKQHLLEQLVRLAHELGATVTAEGIETPGEWNAARAARIDHAQGFLFGRPCATPPRLVH